MATLLPCAADRYRAVLQDLSVLSKKHVAQACEQIRELVGEIRLTPTTDRYLEAVLRSRYEEVPKQAVGAKLSNLVAWREF